MSESGFASGRVERVSLGRIFVFCDSPRHDRRVAVENYEGERVTRPRGVPEDRWTQIPRTRRGMRKADEVVKLQGEEVVAAGAVDAESQGPVRTRFRLRCPRCGHRGAVTLTQESLRGALTQAKTREGRGELSLSELAAILRERSKVTSPRTPRQGQA